MGDPSPDPLEESNRARNGKIASLPRAIRDEINRRLDEGERGPPILAWLNSEKAVLNVLDRLWSGQSITQQNLSEWRQGGYGDWRRRSEKVEMLKELAGHALQLGEATGGGIADGSAAIIGSKIMAALETASLEEALKMVKAVHRLRAGDRGQAKLELHRRQLALSAEKIELERQRYRRETTGLIRKWYESREARTIGRENFDYSEKIELLGRAIFGNDWRTGEEEYERFRYDI